MLSSDSRPLLSYYLVRLLYLSGHQYCAQVSHILTALTPDVRKETPPKEVKAKFRDIKEAFANFDFSNMREGNPLPHPHRINWWICMYGGRLIFASRFETWRF